MSSPLIPSIDNATNSSVPTQLGISVHAIDNTGAQILSYCAGKESLVPGAEDISPNSIFRIASCTKLVTSIAALRLVQAGKLRLDDSSLIEQSLPELCNQDVLTSAPGEPFQYEKREKPITLRQLLSHSAGCGYDMVDPRLMAWRKARGEPSLALRGPVVEAHSVPLLYQPGEGWAYGGGLDWTGLLIERVTGVPLGQFLRTEVFDVAGCDDRIGFDSDLEGKDTVMLVTRAEGALKEFPVIPAEAELGGGALLCSTANLVKILADLISPYPKLLDTEWADLLFAPQLESEASIAALRASVPVFSSMTGPLTTSIPTSSVNHGLGGLLITQDSPTLGKTEGTMTWGGAFNCLWFANREQGVAAYYASSIFPPGDAQSSELMGMFVQQVWEKITEHRE